MLMQFVFASAQDISFFHLNIATGLSDNLVSSAVRDKNGILWIGTAEGLNSYDGYSVKKFYKEDYPALSSNDIANLFQDDHDRIWVRDMAGKITLIDEKRNFIPVPVLENGKEVIAYTFFKTKQRGVCVLSGKKIFELSKQQPFRFEKLNWQEDTSLSTGYVQVKTDNNDTLIIISANRLCVFDAGQLKVLHTVNVPGIIAAAWLNNNELLVTTGRNRQLLKVNLAEKRITHNYGNLKDQYGEQIKGYLRHMRKLPDDRFIMTSGYGGVYIFDAVQEKFYRYGHDPLNVRSISANNTAHVFTESNGYVFITTRTAGLNYFNINHQLAGYRTAFKENASGKIFHGFINCITRHRNGNFWLGTQTGLMEWNRGMNLVKFHEYGTMNNEPLNGVEEVRALFFDKEDKLWVGLNRYGIVVLDKNRKVIKYLSRQAASPDEQLPGNWINSFSLSPDNKLWVATGNGFCIINPETMKVEKAEEANALKPLAKFHTYSFYFRPGGEVWIGNNRGAYRYISNRNLLTKAYPADSNALVSVYCFAEDKNGIIYAGSSMGLSLIKDTTVIKNHTRLKGLVNDNCFGMIRDAENNIWIGNDNILLRYNPSDSSFKKYDESGGLNPNGYRSLSYYQAEDGEQIWGSDLGLTYFKPGDLNRLEIPFSVHINSFSAGAESLEIFSGKKIQLPYSQNDLQFGFTAIDLYSNKNIIYEYKLTGADEDWKRTLSPQQVVYTKLSPGTYSFHVRASKDGITWIEASYPVAIIVGKPWWQQTWFRLLVIAFALSTFYFVYQFYRNKKKAEETQQMIDYFANSGYEHSTVEDILWDISRNCISRLGFEDCVIYLLDDERKTLVQKAAYGPKNPKPFEIANPIEIPVGKGIVGDVAKTGKAGIINDTTKDNRYIVDDEMRLSEITVPIIHEGKVLGIIDSENHKKNFFNKEHLKAIQTIASLCSAKISRAIAMDAMRKSKIEVMELNVKMAESKFLNLRLQMNPHFLFNSLSSIQHLIVSQQTTKAYKYLTVFSNFLRSLLKYAEKNFIPLDEELKILKMYIELESLRFDQSFSWEINMDETLMNEEVLVPSLMVQPFAENAIWHGLLHKEGDKKLSIRFKNSTDEFLTCFIEDNGIGRINAASIQKNKISSMVHESKGILIIKERLSLLQLKTGKPASVEIEDLYEKNREPAGTKVIITIPYYNPEES